MHIIYVHGAGASSRSFNYIRCKLPSHVATLIEYNVDTPLVETIDNVKNIILSTGNKDSIIVSHSLGGVIALSVANKIDIKKIVTLSSPFGGAAVANFLRILNPTNQLFKDVSTISPVIMDLKKPENTDVLSIVTSGGQSSLLTGKNDGVISLESQMALKDINYKEYELNHFEVLLSNEVIKDIEKFIF